MHRPNNFAASLSVGLHISMILSVRPSHSVYSTQALLGTEGVAEVFRSQTVSVSNAQHTSRTFYMIAASNEERDAWTTVINSNIKAYAVSPSNGIDERQTLHA